MKFIRLHGCCCLDLRSGTLCIGITFLIGQVVAVIQSVIRNNSLVCAGALDPQSCRHSSRMEMIFTLIGNLVFFSVTALMLLGSTKDKHKLMVPYLVIRATGITVLFFVLWYIAIKHLSSMLAWGVVILLFGNAFVGLEIYLWLVVNSRKLEIEDGED